MDGMRGEGLGAKLRIGFAAGAALLLAGWSTGAWAQSTSAAEGQSQPAPSEPGPGGLDRYKVKLIPPQSGRGSATDNIDTSEANLSAAPAVTANLPPVIPAGRPVIGLVLEGGGAMGLAHVGVLQWLEENHIPVDRLGGTSMGALVGALYASGHSVAELKQIATSNILDSIFTFEVPYSDVSFRRREDRRDLPQAIQFGLKGGVSLRNSLLTDRALDAFLRDEFAPYNSHAVDYDQLPIPFRCVATDLTALKPLVFRGGPLPSAVRASISIPGVFSPVEYHHHFLVDGAVMDNLPVAVVKRDLQAQVLIAVHLTDTPLAEGQMGSIVGVFARAFSAGTNRNVEESVKLADVLLLPGTDKFTTMDYNKADQLMAAGYKSAELQRAQLMKYALSDADWAEYLAAKRSRARAKPGLMQALHVESTAPAAGLAGAEQTVAVDLAPLRQQPIDPAKITAALGHVQSNGGYEASFETFSDATPSTGPVGGTGAVQAGAGSTAVPDTGVLVRLNPVRNGPPFLLFGADLTAATSNVTRTAFDLRLVDQNLGGYGSELRADLRLGFLTEATAEYYRLLSPKGWFVQPHIGIVREPVYQWTNQHRTSEWFEQEAGGGIDLGRTFNRNLQVALEYRKQELRWKLTSGDTTEPNVGGSAQTAVAHMLYDSSQTGTISPKGIHVDVSAGALFDSVASEDAPLVQAQAARTVTLWKKNVIGVSANVDTYFRRNVTNAMRFTLGGPLRLSASSIDEYRGTDDYLVRLGYLHRLAALPTGLGQGLYFTTVYESGEVWSPERRAFLRQDVLSGLVASTPLGLITVGGAVGDAGRRKVVFSVGKLF